MDPDEALKTARAAATYILSNGGHHEQCEELAEAFEALDGWLSKGGFLPKDWQQKK